MERDDRSPVDRLEGHLAAFSGRLGTILGRRRLNRDRKREKAAAAMLAVEDMVADIEDDVEGHFRAAE